MTWTQPLPWRGNIHSPASATVRSCPMTRTSRPSRTSHAGMSSTVTALVRRDFCRTRSCTQMSFVSSRLKFSGDGEGVAGMIVFSNFLIQRINRIGWK